MTEVMMVAAEASSALFALRLIEHLKKQKKDLHFFGVGSDQMELIGFERMGKAEEMAVVGAAEIIEHYSELKKIFNKLVSEAARRRPRVVIVMDYPEFNLMLAKKLHALGIPVVYYISPQVWAWRKSRVETIKKYCHKVLLLFPFEQEFYKSKNVPYEFVGHPLLDELDPKYFQPEYLKTHRARCGVSENEIVIGLMPGSRRGEIKQHLGIQLEVARRLCRKYSNIRILLMVAPSRTKEEIQDQLENLTFPLMLQKDDPFEMIHLSDFILAASGTATLQVALLEKPMVIMYRMKWLTGIIAKVLVRGVSFFGLPNLIAGKEIVPERWQSGASVDELFKLMCEYVDSAEKAQQTRQDLKDLKKFLGEKGATEKVAKNLEEFLT